VHLKNFLPHDPDTIDDYRAGIDQLVDRGDFPWHRSWSRPWLTRRSWRHCLWRRNGWDVDDWLLDVNGPTDHPWNKNHTDSCKTHEDQEDHDEPDGRSG
jgi:hypothetical protein